MKFLCSIVGHDPEDKVYPVYTNCHVEPEWPPVPEADGSCSCQPIGYYMRPCKRCRKHIPINAENAARKEQVRQQIAAVMNASRAEYGLKPLSWES